MQFVVYKAELHIFQAGKMARFQKVLTSVFDWSKIELCPKIMKHAVLRYFLMLNSKMITVFHQNAILTLTEDSDSFVMSKLDQNHILVKN